MKERCIIVGASIAGLNVAATLIKQEYPGDIILIDRKETMPYNPYPLSKDWMQSSEQTPIYLKEDSFYEQIDLRLKTNVESFDPITKTIQLNNKEVLEYDKLIIATGSRLRTLWAPHEDAEGIFYLRSFKDALAIKNYAKDVQDIVLIGGGFISLELASSFSQMGKNVTVLNRSEYPLENILGVELSKYFMKMHLSHGVKIRCSEELTTFNVDKFGKVKSINTNLNEELKAQMVIIAIGVIPNLSITHPNLKTFEGAILVNEFNETSLKDVYACGDITNWPYENEHIHIEHWENAYNQGISTAKNIINPHSNAFTVRPYFWTDQYDQTFEYLGFAPTWYKTIVRGSLSTKKFTVAYVDKENIPLAILFANKMDRRKEVTNFLNKKMPIIEEKFTDLNIKLSDL